MVQSVADADETSTTCRFTESKHKAVRSNVGKWVSLSELTQMLENKQNVYDFLSILHVCVP